MLTCLTPEPQVTNQRQDSKVMWKTEQLTLETSAEAAFLLLQTINNKWVFFNNGYETSAPLYNK